MKIDRIQAIRDQAERNPAYIEGVKRGRADADAGRTITLEELFRELGDKWHSARSVAL